MTDRTASTPLVPLRDLRRALGAICWGIGVAWLCNLGFSSTAAGNRTSIDLADVVGLGIVLIGAHDLPFARANDQLRVQQRWLEVLAGVALVANVLTLVAPINAAMTLVGATAWAMLLLLLMVVMSDAMTVVGADALATHWRRLAVVWLVLGIAAVASAAVLLFAFHEAPRSGGGGWQWSLQPDRDHSIWWWVLGSTIGIGVVTFAAGILTLVVAVRTRRWLGHNAGSESPPRDRPPSAPIETGDASGPRLGRDGDRVIYYVDPEPDRPAP